MTNFEKYKDEILKYDNFGVSNDNKIVNCNKITCDNCIFSSRNNEGALDCTANMVRWLYKEAEMTRGEQIKDINKKFSEYCRNKKCSKCKYHITNFEIGMCRTAFTYDYLKEKEK